MAVNGKLLASNVVNEYPMLKPFKKEIEVFFEQLVKNSTFANAFKKSVDFVDWLRKENFLKGVKNMEEFTKKMAKALATKKIIVLVGSSEENRETTLEERRGFRKEREKIIEKIDKKLKDNGVEEGVDLVARAYAELDNKHRGPWLYYNRDLATSKLHEDQTKLTEELERNLEKEAESLIEDRKRSIELTAIIEKLEKLSQKKAEQLTEMLFKAGPTKKLLETAKIELETEQKAEEDARSQFMAQLDEFKNLKIFSNVNKNSKYYLNKYMKRYEECKTVDDKKKLIEKMKKKLEKLKNNQAKAMLIANMMVQQFAFAQSMVPQLVCAMMGSFLEENSKKEAENQKLLDKAEKAAKDKQQTNVQVLVGPVSELMERAKSLEPKVAKQITEKLLSAKPARPIATGA